MRIRLLFLAGAMFALIGRAGAGSVELAAKETAPPSITESEPWQFTIAIPGWLPSINGTIGVRGVDANIDVPVTDVLQHFDIILLSRAEARKGPFAIYSEFDYIALSDNTQINGMINNVHERANIIYVDGGLSWRFVNQPRWSVDFAAGTHYSNVYEQLELHDDPALIQQTSEQFVTNISDDLRARLNNDISNSEFLASLTSTIEEDIVSRIDHHKSLDHHQSNPRIPIGPLAGHIKQDVARVVEDLIRAKEAELRAEIDALHLHGAARRAAVHRIVSAAEAEITQELTATLDSKLSQTLSKQDDWFDPYVGLYGRYNFNKTYYTALRGQIGGFGVGADLMWQIEASLGIHLTHCIFTEIGYRALGANFENNNFKFDVVLHGPQITTGITF